MNDWMRDMTTGKIENLPDPFDQSNVDGFKEDTDDAAAAMMAFGRAMARSAAQIKPEPQNRAERRAADRAKRRKGNK